MGLEHPDLLSQIGTPTGGNTTDYYIRGHRWPLPFGGECSPPAPPQAQNAPPQLPPSLGGEPLQFSGKCSPPIWGGAPPEIRKLLPLSSPPVWGGATSIFQSPQCYEKNLRTSRKKKYKILILPLKYIKIFFALRAKRYKKSYFTLEISPKFSTRFARTKLLIYPLKYTDYSIFPLRFA